MATPTKRIGYGPRSRKAWSHTSSTAFACFVWSRKHHRYETAYIERNVIGHFPIEVNNSGAAPSFSLILEADEGQLVRKTYSFEGFRVRMVNKEPYVGPAPDESPQSGRESARRKSTPKDALLVCAIEEIA